MRSVEASFNTPPLEMLSHFSPLAPFWNDKGDFAVNFVYYCGTATKGRYCFSKTIALWKPATFEKVDETFTYVFNSAFFLLLHHQKKMSESVSDTSEV